MCGDIDGGCIRIRVLLEINIAIKGCNSSGVPGTVRCVCRRLIDSKEIDGRKGTNYGNNNVISNSRLQLQLLQ